MALFKVYCTSSQLVDAITQGQLSSGFFEFFKSFFLSRKTVKHSSRVAVNRELYNTARDERVDKTDRAIGT